MNLDELYTKIREAKNLIWEIESKLDNDCEATAQLDESSHYLIADLRDQFESIRMHASYIMTEYLAERSNYTPSAPTPRPELTEEEIETRIAEVNDEIEVAQLELEEGNAGPNREHWLETRIMVKRQQRRHYMRKLDAIRTGREAAA